MLIILWLVLLHVPEKVINWILSSTAMFPQILQILLPLCPLPNFIFFANKGWKRKSTGFERELKIKVRNDFLANAITQANSIIDLLTITISELTIGSFIFVVTFKMGIIGV